MISESLAEDLVGVGLDRVTVSVDGPPSVHDRVRGRDGVFAKAEEGIANLLSARRSYGSGAPTVGIHCTITSINADSIAEMPAVAKRLGVEALSLQLVSVTTEDEVAGSLIGGSPASGGEFVCDGQAILPSLEQASRIRAFARETSREWFSSQLALLASMSPEEISQGRFPVRACSVIRRDLIVDPYGVVLPCSHLGEYPLGDLRRQSVAEVWSGDRRKRLLRTIGKALLPVCVKCCHHPPNLTFWQKGMLYLETRGGRR
jgi:radical SAM protein with 4Fe4S-binding SPASM domain